MKIENNNHIQLTEYDLTIFKLLYRFRVLNTKQIETLGNFKNSRYLQRRLLALFSAQYIDRPPEQRYIFTNQKGAYPIVSALGSLGVKVLQEKGFNVGSDFIREKNKKIKALSLEHALYHADFFVELHRQCKTSGIARIIWKDEILAEASTRQSQLKKPFIWDTEIIFRGEPTGSKIEPDDVFGIEFFDLPKSTRCKYFFLEIDSGSMPIVRENVAQSSILRKLYSYAYTHNQKLAKTLFGLSNFRVLFDTSSYMRVANMEKAFQQYIAGDAPETIYCFRARKGQALTLDELR